MTVAKYDQETRERALRLYYEAVAKDGATKSGARRKIGGILDINPATLHNWIRKTFATNAQAMAESEQDKDAELAQLRKDNRQLKQANEILKLASAFFAQAECERTLK